MGKGRKQAERVTEVKEKRENSGERETEKEEEREILQRKDV